MKKLLLLSSIACFGVALATDIETANAYGVMSVTGSGAATMVAIPFVGDGKAIEVTQMVKAKNLDTGDMIYALPTGSDNKYCVWKLTYTAKDGYKWEAVTGVEVGSNPTQFTPASADSTTLARGNGFWLVRKNGSGTTFYVNGNVDTSTAAAITVSKGWNLVGQSSATGTKTLGDVEGVVGDGGSVRLNNGTRYVYRPNHKTQAGWYSVSGNDATYVANSTKLPAGEGFWLVRKTDCSTTLSL